MKAETKILDAKGWVNITNTDTWRDFREKNLIGYGEVSFKKFYVKNESRKFNEWKKILTQINAIFGDTITPFSIPLRKVFNPTIRLG